MTAPHSTYEPQFYHRLVSDLLADSGWRPRPETDPLDAVAQRAAIDDSIGELRAQHLDSDATLTLLVPDYRSETAARVLLDHPLDERIPNEEGRFIGQFRQTREQIAGQYRTEHLQPIADTSLVCRAHIPYDHDPQFLETTMTTLSTIAGRIQRLHDDMREPLLSADTETMRRDQTAGSTDE